MTYHFKKLKRKVRALQRHSAS